MQGTKTDSFGTELGQNIASAIKIELITNLMLTITAM
jgi:hypothetical protein